MAAQFRSYVWDPALIVAQMVLLQAGYYSSLGLWLALLGTLGSTGPSLQQVFSDEVRARPGKPPWAQAPAAGGIARDLLRESPRSREGIPGVRGSPPPRERPGVGAQLP